MYTARIVMLTARAMPSDYASGIAAGADEYLTKPFEEAELRHAIRTRESASESESLADEAEWVEG